MTAALKFGLHLDGVGFSLAESVDFVRTAEQAGMDSAWHGEGARDAMVPLAAFAATTATIGLGTSIANWARPPVTMERVASNLGELSGGRFVLGLGTMPRVRNERWYGIEWSSPLRRMREYIECIRTLMAAQPNQPVSFAGDYFTIDRYIRNGAPCPYPVPIILGAHGVKATELAGEIADGVSFNSMLPPEALRASRLPALARGVSRGQRGRPMVLGTALTAISEDRATAVRWAKGTIGAHLAVGDYFAEVVRGLGFGSTFDRIQQLGATGELDAVVEAVPDELVEAVALAGTPADVWRKAKAYAGLVDVLLLHPPTDHVDAEVIKAVHHSVIDVFAP